MKDLTPMRIRVKLIGRFVEKFGFSEKELEAPAPFTAGDLAARLGMAGLDQIVTRSGQALCPAQSLADGDRVVIAPIFSGG